MIDTKQVIHTLTAKGCLLAVETYSGPIISSTNSQLLIHTVEDITQYTVNIWLQDKSMGFIQVRNGIIIDSNGLLITTVGVNTCIELEQINE